MDLEIQFKSLAMMIFIVQKLFQRVRRETNISFVHFVFYYFPLKGANNPEVTNIYLSYFLL